MWPDGIKSAVCLIFDFDAETAWIEVDPRACRCWMSLSRPQNRIRECGSPPALKSRGT